MNMVRELDGVDLTHQQKKGERRIRTMAVGRKPTKTTSAVDWFLKKPGRKYGNAGHGSGKDGMERNVRRKISIRKK